jgi:hypothetical protein
LVFSSKGKILFLLASLGFAVALPQWGLGFFWSTPFYIGLLAALFGAWIVWEKNP